MTSDTLIICSTIVISIISISVAISYCFHQACETRLMEQTSRQEFEKAKLEAEQDAITKKWEREDKVRQSEQDRKKENKDKEEAL